MRIHWNENVQKYKSRIITVVILLLILLYAASHTSETERSKILLESESSHLKKQQIIYKKKIEFLTSVLKRFKVPEEEYSDGNPTIFIITPTHTRSHQKAELTRLKNVFLLVPSIHWIIVEDSALNTTLVASFLASSGIPFTHLYEPTPAAFKLTPKEPNWRKPRGVWQRNKGIAWLRQRYKTGDNGVVYFADDDNTYSVELFKEMRWTTRVSVWPVALVGGLLVERPIVEDGHVIGWKTAWAVSRPFATDMAGFAVGLSLLMSTPNAQFAIDRRPGYIESNFLSHLVVNLEDLEPMAQFCTKVYVWHTRTEHPKLDKEKDLAKKGLASNYGMEI